ncbi:MAG: flagellar hook protein FlgE [Phycisphaerales bacterium]|jgi:flagellar hook protein FlgE
MASTTSLFTGLSGLNVHARRLDVIANNIANVNTTAYKSTTMLFENLFARTFSGGSAPGGASGGTNPFQVGLGVGVAATRRDFTPGSFNPTGDPRDLAVDGSGFFVVERDGSTFYTRAGAFRQDLNDNLVTVSGEILQGYAVDANYNLIEGALSPISIPIGKQVIAEASTLAVIAGNLNSGGELPGQGAAIAIGSAIGVGFVDIASAAITAATLITAIEDPASPGSTTPAFTAGETISLDGASKGGTQLDTAELVITATTTVQELLDFMAAALGIHNTGSPNPDGATPGVTVDGAGIITIVGNSGEANDLAMTASDLRVADASGGPLGSPFVPEKTGTADGESVKSTLLVYDSLGTPITVDVTLVLDNKAVGAGTEWRYYVDSGDDSDLDIRIAQGTIQFDGEGQLLNATPITLTVDRDGTGAITPLGFELAFTGDSGNLTALDSDSQVANVFRDGLPPGTLETYGIQGDGTIFGGFSNGAIRTLGQVVLADFANPEGLIDAGANNWSTGPNSGPATVVRAATFGTGGIVSGALEASNVDLSKEFTDLILVQTGYSASARVIRTADELMQQLLVLGR